MRNIKNVLVPVSFAPSCKKAVDMGAQIAVDEAPCDVVVTRTDLLRNYAVVKRAA